jgi:hypothetical protein
VGSGKPALSEAEIYRVMEKKKERGKIAKRFFLFLVTDNRFALPL